MPRQAAAALTFDVEIVLDHLCAAYIRVLYYPPSRTEQPTIMTRLIISALHTYAYSTTHHLCV